MCFPFSNYIKMKKLFLIAIVIAFISQLFASCNERTTRVKWATFNIRYDNPEDSLNNWKYRRDSVANYIKSQHIDICGMQEVLWNQLVDLGERLPEYDYVGVVTTARTKVRHRLYFSARIASTQWTVARSGCRNILIL